MGRTVGRLRGGPPNSAASNRASSHSGPSGHVILAASALCKYSCAVSRPIEQLRAIARSPRPTSNFNRRTSLILRTDNLLAGKLILPFEGRLPAIVLSSAASRLWKSFRRSRTLFRDRPETVRLHPGTGVHLHPGILFGIIPEHRSESSRNRVHLAPDSPQTLSIMTIPAMANAHFEGSQTAFRDKPKHHRSVGNRRVASCHINVEGVQSDRRQLKLPTTEKNS